MKKIDGEILCSAHIAKYKRSGDIVEYPTSEKIDIKLEGETYHNRTVFRRETRLNTRANKRVIEFVVINNRYYKIVEA